MVKQTSRSGASVFAGIDMTAGRRPIDLAVINNRLEILRLATLDLPGAIEDLRSVGPAVVAIDAPAQVSSGLLAEATIRAEVGLPPGGVKWARYRVAEFELRRRGINLYVTPMAEGAAPLWMRQGFELYRRLKTSGFALGQQRGASSQWAFEVYTHACFTALLGHLPFAKGTLEGRVQRQLVLYREGLRVSDPVTALEEITAHHLLAGRLELAGLLSPDALDALVAAFTAYLAATQPKRVTWVGHPQDGKICLPAERLAERYAREAA